MNTKVHHVCQTSKSRTCLGSEQAKFKQIMYNLSYRAPSKPSRDVNDMAYKLRSDGVSDQSLQGSIDAEDKDKEQVLPNSCAHVRIACFPRTVS